MFFATFVQKKPTRELSGCLWSVGDAIGDHRFSGFSRSPIGPIRKIIGFAPKWSKCSKFPPEFTGRPEGVGNKFC